MPSAAEAGRVAAVFRSVEIGPVKLVQRTGRGWFHGGRPRGAMLLDDVIDCTNASRAARLAC